MLQYISADDVVIACITEEAVQVAVFQIGHMDLAIKGGSVACLFLAEGEAIADALLVFGKEGTQGPTAATQIQYVRPRAYMACQHGQ
jgi:hypothetical protein